ncbi:MAG: hypothetical protein Q9185_006317 [Variospora sp. 1 TL-2023]
MWLFVLAISGTEDDYLHLTKRFGIIAASQLPLHYLLALKSSYSPISLLTRLSHEELNPYHRALGRILLIFLSLHASFYLNFYVQKSLLLKRIRDADVILGLLAITSLLILGTTALARIRRKNYLLFFTVHVALSISLLPILYFHVSHLRPYILESAIIYALLILQRNVSQTSTPSATLAPVPGTKNLVSISIPLPPALRTRTFHPGQHIYLSLPASHPHGNKLRLNPFTVANLPAKDKHIHLVLRALDGTTSLLAGLASSQTPPAQQTLLIEGPYGAAANFPSLASFSKILLVAGGVGATFTLPVYRHLLDRGGDNAASRVKFIWAVKSLADARWGLPHLGEGSEVYVSRGRQSQRVVSSSRTKEEEAEEEEEEEEEEEDDDDDPKDSKEASSSSMPLLPLLPPRITIHHHHRSSSSRPDFRPIVNDIFAAGRRPAKVAILVCGPPGMSAALRREVAPWVLGAGGGEGRKKEVWWHSEEFAW